MREAELSMEQDIYVTIGRRLRARRRLLDLTQRDVGALCGVTFQQVQKYEAGEVKMTVSRLIAFAKVLRMPAEALMQGLQDDPGPAGENASQARSSRLVA
jgi:transcriptional regulator with XRE-family HTH domain